MLGGGTAVDWSEIAAFVDKREPGAGERAVGATPVQIEALQRQTLIPLPKNYIEFLRWVGSADGGFRIFPEHSYLVQDLLDHTPAMGAWDSHRFFLVGFQDPRVVREDPHELFFDLLRSDGIDAPLVGFQPGPAATEMNIEHGIADWTIFRLAWRYAMDRKPARARLISWCDAEPAGAAALGRQHELVAATMKLGFERCMPATPHTWFGKRDQETFALIQIDPDDDMVSVDLRGEDRLSVIQASEVLEDQSLAERGRIIGE